MLCFKNKLHPGTTIHERSKQNKIKQPDSNMVKMDFYAFLKWVINSLKLV